MCSIFAKALIQEGLKQIKEKQRGTAAGADLAVLKSKAKNEMDRKPGSVLIDDLSTPAIADRF